MDDELCFTLHVLTSDLSYFPGILTRKFQNNIKLNPQLPPPSGSIFCPATEVTAKGEVPRALEHFFHGIAVKSTLNDDLLSHSIASWA